MKIQAYLTTDLHIFFIFDGKIWHSYIKDGTPYTRKKFLYLIHRGYQKLSPQFILSIFKDDLSYYHPIMNVIGQAFYKEIDIRKSKNPNSNKSFWYEIFNEIRFEIINDDLYILHEIYKESPETFYFDDSNLENEIKEFIEQNMVEDKKTDFLF